MSTKGKWLTIEQKCELIAQHRSEPSTTYTQLALWTKSRFDLSVPPTRQTIRNILQAAAEIESKRQSDNVTAKGRRLCVRSRELENQLGQYVRECQTRGVQLTRRLLQSRAREIRDTMQHPPVHNLSVGWLTRFMKRHGLRFQKERGSLAEETMKSTKHFAQEIICPDTKSMIQESTYGLNTATDRAHVERLRLKAIERLREIEKEAKGIRKYLRILDGGSKA
ncbi:short chain [Plasmopara halstedii]|uniref:Short chain n=1 Tax=Plasmopara halstedii TaxID=4781 RepID=A0A0P1B496_PLAHL|nr:short chain [Plasmopara halstedii]CEG48943.1 short chain [Plasmopara halstedii]|eukprot:XP_024585312.1 short chain [Plasmopara halstedii]